MDMKTLPPNFEKRLVAMLAHGLPLVSRPYAAIAEQLECTEADVIEGLNRLIQRKDIKRYGVVVRHRELGYRANGMVVWDIADEHIEEVGQCIGKYDFVTLCYQRPRRLPKWRYNLFSMVHGQDRASVIEKVDFIAEQCGLQDVAREILFSGRRFKQRGAHYNHVGLSPNEAATITLLDGQGNG
jgi:DNA-binding Lrp family transcriptional regulator